MSEAIYARAWSSKENAERYERSRPPYSDAAIAFAVHRLGLGPGSQVLDVGAGTGKLSRQLFRHDLQILAVEPLQAMRETFARVQPFVPVVEGAAEHLPVEAGTIDAVVAGQAWHWFDSNRALDEVTRVLKPLGGIALFWNDYDQTSAWVTEFARIRDQGELRAPEPSAASWSSAFSGRDEWSPLQEARFTHTVLTERGQLVDRMLSSSTFATASQAERERIDRDICDILDRHAETREREEIPVPYVTKVFWARRGPVD